MKRVTRSVLVAAVAYHLLSATAAAEPFPEPEPIGDEVIHVTVPSVLTVPSGGAYALPPGWFLPEPRWDALDFEVRRLQDAETRLGAENRYLRDEAGGTVGWRAVVAGLAGALAVGIAVGAYAF